MDRTEEDPVEGSISRGCSDFLQLRPDDAPAGGLADWLAGELRRAVADGRLPVGSRLPASRVLAAELRVSRGVVTEAYRRLSEDGHVVGRGRRGTVVVAAPPALEPDPPPRAAPRAAAPRSDPFTESGGDPAADVFAALRAAPARIDLTPGRPDLAAFPRAAWLRAERAVLARLGADDLGYGDHRGAPALRSAVARWLARNRGITAHPDEVVIVSGVAQALALFAQVLRAEGVREIAVEDPGSLGARQQLRSWGAATPPVPVDADGIRVEALRDLGAPAVLLTPAHQFPTGVVLGGRRRRALMRWAAEGGLVLEDDYDAEHRYDRPPVPALRAMLPERVWYAGSVSKLLAPAMRLGWVLAPPAHLGVLGDAKRDADLGSPVLPQLVLARLIDSGDLERHLRVLRRRHRRRRDAVIAAIRAHLPGATVHGAAAGLHLTVTFDAFEGAPGAVSDTRLAAAALARGVKVHPLSWHSQRRRPHPEAAPPGLVLGYAAGAPDVLTEGVAILGEALRSMP